MCLSIGHHPRMTQAYLLWILGHFKAVYATLSQSQCEEKIAYEHILRNDTVHSLGTA
jgi:hypothetical protein